MPDEPYTPLPENQSKALVSQETPPVEAKYRTLFESIDEGFCIFELIYDGEGKAIDYRFLEVNRVFERQTGLHNAPGKRGSEIAQGAENYWLAAYEQVARTGEPQRIEHYNRVTGRWYNAYVSRIGEADSGQVCTVFDDITERKRHEANRALLAEISFEVAGFDEIEETMERLGEKIGRHFDVRQCMFAEIQDFATSLATYGWHAADAPSLEGTYRIRDFLSDQQITVNRAGGPSIVNDTQTDPRVSAQSYGALGIHSFIIVPLVREGKWRTMISVIDNKAREWRDDEVDLLREITERIWTRLERARVEKAVRQSEAQFRALVTASSDVIYQMSPDWKEMRHLIGRDFIPDTQGPSGTWLESYIPEEARPQVWAAIEHAIVTKSPFELEHQVIQANGMAGWTFSRAVPLLDEQGEITAWFGTATNITERKRMEESLRESETKYRTLFESIDEGFCIFEMVYDAGGDAVDWVYRETNPAFEKQTGFIDPVGKRISELQPDLEQSWFEQFARVARTGEPVRFVQYTEAMGIWYDVYALSIGGAGANRVSLLFTDITERKRAEEQQAFLLQFSDVLRSLDHPLEIQRVAMRMLGEHLGATRAFYFLTEPEEDGNWIHIIETDYRRDPAMPSHVGRHSVKDFGLGLFKDAQYGQVVEIADVTKVPELTTAEIQKYLAINVVAFINVPLIRDGKFVAGIGAHDSSPRPWKPAEIALIREVAARTWSAVGRASAEEAVHQNEEQQAFLLGFSDALNPLSDVLQIQEEACRLLGEYLKVDRAYYVEVNEAEDYARVERDYLRGDSPSLAGKFSLEEYGWIVPYLQQGETVVVADDQTADIVPEADRAAMAAVKIQSHISTPVTKAGQLVGALCVTESIVREWMPDEVELVRDVAGRLWATIQHAR